MRFAMPRIRTIKPEFWRNAALSRLSEFTRLLAIAVLNLADDEGYFEADARLVRGDVFPYDEDSLRTHGGLTELSRIGYITIRTSKTKGEIGRVCNFEKHQVINRPTPSKLKADYVAAGQKTNVLLGEIEKTTRLTEDSRRTHGGLTEEAVLEEEQGTGKRNREREMEREMEKEQGIEIDACAISVSSDKNGRRRTKKKDAEASWKKAIRKTSPAVLVAKAAEYAASEVGSGEFAVMPSVWLNAGQWEDDPASWIAATKILKTFAQQRLENTSQAIEDFVNG